VTTTKPGAGQCGGNWGYRRTNLRTDGDFGVTRDRVASIKAQLNISDAFVRQSVRHLLIWERLRNLAVRPAKVSQP